MKSDKFKNNCNNIQWNLVKGKCHANFPPTYIIKYINPDIFHRYLVVTPC